ncbi:hypothetical protein Aperf_G00000026758 [Anoplocephala perfoliata]
MVTESEHFLAIRKKLNVLGYSQPFGEDSLPLIERLLDDLILTTHGLRESKHDSLRKTYLELNDQCEALKGENLVLKNECININRKISDITNEKNESGNESFGLRHKAINSDSSGGANIDEKNNLIDTLTQRCRELEGITQLLQKEKELTDKKIANFKKQVELQDEEINRLHGLVDNPIETQLKEPQRRDREQLIERMQSEADALRTRNRELEQRMLLQLESLSRNAAITVSSSDVSSVRESSAQCNLRSGNGWAVDKKMINPGAPAFGRVLIAPGRQIMISFDKNELSELLDNYDKTSSHFINRTDELVNFQKRLVLEIDRLNGLLPPSKRTTSATKRNLASTSVKRTPVGSTIRSAISFGAKRSVIDYDPPIKEYIEGLLADRKVLRAQVESLDRSLRRCVESGNGNTTVTSSTIYRSPSSKDKGTSTIGSLKNAYTQTGGQVSPPTVSGARKSDSETLKALLQAVESERDHYIRQSEELKIELKRVLRFVFVAPSRFRSSSPSSAANGDMDADLESVKRERNELQATLNKFEQRLLEIQSEVLLLRSERDQLLLQLEKVHQVTDSKSAPQAGNITEIRSVKSSNELFDQRQYLKELETAQLRISELEREREELRFGLDRVNSQKTETEKVREQLQAALVRTRGHNSALANELMMRKNMYTELVRAKQLSDSALTEAQHDLQVLNSRIKELESQMKRDQEELMRLHSVAAQLDAEKDAIQASLDGRTEDVVALKAELSKANKTLEEKTQFLQSVEQRLRQVTEMAADKDREVHLLTERLKELETSSKIVTQSRNISEQKYTKAQSDITVLAAEVESLKSRLQNASNAKSNLQSRLTEAMHGLSHSEQAMDSKLKEHKDLLVQYGLLSRDFEEMARRNAELERNFVDLQGALRSKEAELRENLDRTQKAELEALNAKRERSAFEEKCARLNAAAEEAEARAHQLDGEVEEVRRDLAVTRDLACTLQSRLDSAAGHSVSVVAATNDLTAKLEDCELKLRDALNETTHQRKIVVQLETLLAAARENQLRLQESLDKKTEECEKLRRSSKYANPQVTLNTITEASNSENRQPIASVGAVSDTATPRRVDATQTNLLFYNPLDPSVTTASSSPSPDEIPTSPSHQKATRHRSSETAEIIRLGSPGPTQSLVNFYEPRSVSDILSTNQSSSSSTLPAL